MVDDGISRLPDDIIVDVYLKFPEILGDRAFVSAVTIGPKVVTITIIGTGATFAPIAAISLKKPIDIYRQYELEALYPQTFGWIAFGDGVNEIEQKSYRFSGSEQSLLLAQAARRDPNPSVPTIGKVFLPGLTGVVRLQGGTDIEIVSEERELGGKVQDAIIIRLRDKVNEEGRNILEDYVGPKGKRPESNNCGDPEPIEFVNTVSPDCCGNLFIEFRGCGDIQQSVNDACGVMVDCGFGLSEACITADKLPDESGKLPNEYDDLCVDVVAGADTTTAAVASVDIIDPPIGTEPSAGLPWIEDFNDQVVDELTTVTGTFTLERGGAGSGYAHLGELVSVTRYAGNVCKVITDTEHGVVAGDTVHMVNSEVSAYNVKHTVVNVVDDFTFTTSNTYVSDSLEGSWVRLVDDIGPGYGFAVGITSITDNGSGKCRFVTDYNHGLVLLDDIETVYSSVAGYNLNHSVTAIGSLNQFDTDVNYTADAGSVGFFIIENANAGGGVFNILAGGTEGKTEVSTDIGHGLGVGEKILVINSPGDSYNRIHEILEVPGNGSVITDVDYVSDASDGIWMIAAETEVDPNAYVFVGDTLQRNIAIWNQGFPTTPTWQATYRRAYTTVKLVRKNNTLGNAGLIVNYQSNDDFWLFEIDYEMQQARLGHVLDGTYYVYKRLLNLDLVLDNRYRLLVEILPLNTGGEDALVNARILGLDDGMSESFTGEIARKFYPDTGYFGIHCYRSAARFEDIGVEYYDA